MARLEDLARGTAVRGVLPDGLVTVVDVKWIGTAAIELTYKDASGRLGNELIYRDREASLEVLQAGAPWSFDADGDQFRLVSEALRIRLAYLFDPHLAVHTSLVEPLPHQITAVYGEMIQRHPLKFLLADDPGSGKTIMAGLFIKELIARGDLQECLIVCPGNLVEQWQDEMDRRFHLPFEIMTNDKWETARTGNWFAENPLAICRLDKLSRNEDVQEKLKTTDWDLIICDEAHKMSASFYGIDVKYTKRYRLGELLSGITRHFLLLTATPHNGKEEDFQLFMALLDPDRFAGRFRDGVHSTDASDLMRRMVKEDLLTFEGNPLFPERIAYTMNYTLSTPEADLYRQVTNYVREEFNRADALESEGRKGTVGFALTILQRRLASSPEAIYQSLRRRKEKLEKRMRELKQMSLSAAYSVDLNIGLPEITEDDLEELEDSPDEELESTEEEIVDQATAARTVTELQAEIELLRHLEAVAHNVRQLGTDRKWEELSSILQNSAEMFESPGVRHKLIIFTEHRDTLNYLVEKIISLLGRPEAVVTIFGGMGRDQRKKAEQMFTQDKNVEVLVATDAAGEGINLQRAHLMVNYDLPWNPNRLEQRFGRIHRIGQTEVCHLWNLVAKETREGDVYYRLLEKLDQEREALGGKVFDVLGRLKFEDRSLRNLLMEAIRYGERPEVRARLYQAVDKATNTEYLTQLYEEHALARDSMDATMVRKIRKDMERAEARRLQPHFIATFFIHALQTLGGTIREREQNRYEVTHVPAVIRSKSSSLQVREPILSRYERITFEKKLISMEGKPVASFVCPGHPLLDAVITLVLDGHRDVLKQGATLVDVNDPSDQPRILVYLEHSIQDARIEKSGQRRIVSRQLQFIEIDSHGNAVNAGPAPHLAYRALSDEEQSLLERSDLKSLHGENVEIAALGFAVSNLVPQHLKEVQERKEEIADRTIKAVKERLTREITYWDRRAEEVKSARAGRQN